MIWIKYKNLTGEVYITKTDGNINGNPDGSITYVSMDGWGVTIQAGNVLGYATKKKWLPTYQDSRIKAIN